MSQLGKILMIMGLAITAIGLLVWLLGSKLTWFGNLPGDIRIERENFKIYIPIVSMLLLSIFLSFIFWLVGKFFK